MILHSPKLGRITLGATAGEQWFLGEGAAGATSRAGWQRLWLCLPQALGATAAAAQASKPQVANQAQLCPIFLRQRSLRRTPSWGKQALWDSATLSCLVLQGAFGGCSLGLLESHPQRPLAIPRAYQPCPQAPQSPTFSSAQGHAAEALGRT